MGKHTPARESSERRKQRALTILRRLIRSYPEATVALEHHSPLELLIATILSAQCTDARVNLVTKELFKKYRSAADYAHADLRELEEDIRSTGFYRMKAKNIVSCCSMLLNRHRGKVPDTMEELTQLAGVGRKTANVVLSNAFGKTEGIVVDTHVKRLAMRMGLTRETDPEKVESDLMGQFPKNSWKTLDDVLIWHGRRVCSARKPACADCPVNDVCPSSGSFT